MKNNFFSSKIPKTGVQAQLSLCRGLFCRTTVMKQMYLVALLTLSTLSFGQDLISDGGFETQASIAAATTPWFSSAGGISITEINPRGGTKAMLWGTTFRTLNQAITAVPGTTYLATFYVRSNQTSVTGDGNVYVAITNGSNVALIPPIAGVSAPFITSASGYVKYTFIFTAPQANLTLAMSKGAGGNNTINIDDVSIVPTVLPTASDALSSTGSHIFPYTAAVPTFTANPVVPITSTYRGVGYSSGTAPTNAGAYNVAAYIANGTGRDYLVVPFIIAGASSVTTVPASLVNTGQALSTATFTGAVTNVAGTFALDSPTTVPSVGSSTHNYTFTPTDTTNFTTVTGSLLVITGQVFGWNTSALAGGTNSFGAQGLAATTRNTNLTVGGLTRSGFTTSGTGAARGWGGLALNTTTQASAITATQYITFTVKPTNSGTTLSLSSIEPFSYRRSATGPASGALQYSTDGTNFTNITTSLSFSVTANTGGSIASIDLSGITALQNIPSTTTVTFRLVPYSSSAGGSFYIYDKDISTQSDFSVLGTVKMTSTYTTSWDNGTPIASMDAIIDGDYNGISFFCDNLTVNPTRTLTVATGTSVTVGGALVNNGTIIVENNANVRQTAVANTNSGSGTATVTRNSAALKRLDYTMWSSPVSGSQTLEGFSPNTSRTPNRFYTYNSATDVYTNVATTSVFTPGMGYLIRMPNDASTNATAYSGVFTGTLNNGTINLGTLVANKFYSVGNPYPSRITASSFIEGNAGLGTTLYFWRKTNGTANTLTGSSTGTSYATWTSMGGVASGVDAPNNIAPNGQIAVGQGFIVNTGSATTINFTNAMRTTTAANFLKTKAEATPDRVWLNLTNATGAFSQTLIGYTANATVGLDRGIDGEYINDSSLALTSNINNKEYTIQGRPTFDPTDVVVLNFKTDVAGDYSIALDHFDGVFSGAQDVYLVDSKTGAETDLKAGPYTFNAAAGVDNTRFSLKYQKTLKVIDATLDNNSVSVYQDNGAIYINSKSAAISSVKVFDVQGRLIAEQRNVKANTAVISNLRAKNQLLIVNVVGEDNSEVSKKIMN